MATVFVDVDSQLDFLFPAGALYVPGAERTVPNIARLNRHAAGNGIPVISTVDAHTESDPEFRVWPHHCIAGTHGQRKAESTLLDRRIVIPNRECPLGLAGAQQIIIEKQNVDDKIDFVVNGTVVDSEPRGSIKTDGIWGVRVNHMLEVHVDGLSANKS